VTEGMKPGAADALIKELATFIDAQLREQDLLCRFGAAGFVIGLMIGPAQALAVVQRMAAAVRRNVFRTGNAKITLSAGVSGYPEVQGTAVQYFVAAEIALQQAKQRGRNQVVRYESSMQLQAQTATGIDRL
jgi:diguanylate cyclase (GGDEF)-like protein